MQETDTHTLGMKSVKKVNFNTLDIGTNGGIESATLNAVGKKTGHDQKRLVMSRFLTLSQAVIETTL